MLSYSIFFIGGVIYVVVRFANDLLDLRILLFHEGLLRVLVVHNLTLQWLLSCLKLCNLVSIGYLILNVLTGVLRVEEGLHLHHVLDYLSKVTFLECNGLHDVLLALINGPTHL